MQVEGIQRIFMFVSDVAKSRHFYSAVLGQQPVADTGGDAANHAEFDLNGVSLLLHSDANAHWLPAGAKKGVGTALHFRVGDIDAHYAQLKSAGVDLPEEPELLHTGIRKFAMKDPDGYEVEIVQLPS